MYRQIHCSNSSPILELSVKFASQIFHENINKPLDGAYLADFCVDIILDLIHDHFATSTIKLSVSFNHDNYGNSEYGD